MKIRTIAVTIAAVAALTAGTAGCSGYDASHDYNAPTPVKTWRPAGGWTRVETPGNFPSLIFACYGSDGVYAAMDQSSSAFVVRNDPRCPGYKAGA